MTDPVALYVHWPFCVSKCPYCDFNSVVAEGVDPARWAKALVSEMMHFSGLMEGRAISSIFFGGGTPSLMAPDTVSAVIEAARGQFGLGPDVEITLEANPNTAESRRFRDFSQAGVNRLSLGVQSLDDRALAQLGRVHTAAEARDAIEIAAGMFENYSFDLIYALPDQTVQDWDRQLREVLGLAGPHLSAYQLTVEPGTPFHDQGIEEADEETAAALFETTQEVLEAAEYKAYEVSNHARPGFECRHNLHVWRGGDYLGIGPGAHGRLTRDGVTRATHQIRAPKRWLEAVEEDGHGIAGDKTLTAQERQEERILLGLRLAEGIGLDLTEPLELDKIILLMEGGYLTEIQGRLATTPKGRLCLDAVTAALLS